MKTIAEVYEETLTKDKSIRKHFEGKEVEYNIVWECDIDKELKHDKEMRNVMDEYNDTSTFDPRDCLKGGNVTFLS